MKKRRLNKEEAALWDQVAKTMQPLRPPKAAKISETKKLRSVSSKPTASLGLSDLKVFEIGSKSQTALGQSLTMSRTGSKRQHPSQYCKWIRSLSLKCGGEN